MTSFPRYHVVTWKPTITGTVTVTAGVNFAVIDLAADIGSSYWGWEEAAALGCTSNSIQGRLADLLEAELDVWDVYTIGAAYSWPDGVQAPPRTLYGMVGPLDVQLDFDSVATAAQFGFEGTGPHISAADILLADWHDAGHWSPRQRAAVDESWASNPNTAIAEALDGSARKMWTWGETLSTRLTTWQAVYVADIRSDAAAITSYAEAAGRDTADPNNLLEQVLERARTVEGTDDAPTFRIYTEPLTYETAYLLTGTADLEALCSSVSVHRIYRVAMTWRAG